MANKKELNLASTQAKQMIGELPERREKLQAQVQCPTGKSESQKRVNYQNEFDRLQGAERLTGLHPNVTSRMKELQQEARRSLNVGPAHAIYKTKL